VVEDTPDVIRVINLALRGHFRVLAALGGAKGLELALTHQPSLIITDLMMPDMDGMELTRRLRSDPRTRHIPIVMLTARGDVEDRVAGMDSGVNAYLTKPFSAQELVSTVRGLVRIQETTADLVLTHSMDSLETIAGGLAHEINNPLNYIKNALSLIRTDTEALLSHPTTESPARVAEMTARAHKMFGVAEIGLRRIGVTVGLMQRYAREGYTRALQPYDLFAAVRDVVDMLQSGMEVPVVQVVTEGVAEVACVPEEMNQVLTNLVQNALDAIPRDNTGAIFVRGRLDGDHVVLTVRDNGPGIAPEHRAKIFTPFFTTKDVGKGMGLGLTIVRRVVLSLGGTIDITTPASGGCEVTLRIPAAVSASAGPAARHVFPGQPEDQVR
jgi:signal transduction histidine kinase